MSRLRGVLSLRSTQLVVLIALAALQLVLKLPVLDVPLIRDEGMYGYQGTLALHGYHPILDAWENKPYGVYYWAAFWQFLTASHTAASLRIASWGGWVGILLAAFGLGRRRGLFAAYGSAGLGTLASLSVASDSFRFVTEIPSQCWLLLSLLAVTRASKKWIGAGGACLAFGLLTRQTLLFYLPILLWEIARERLRSRRLLAFVSGGIGGVVLVAMVIGPQTFYRGMTTSYFLTRVTAAQTQDFANTYTSSIFAFERQVPIEAPLLVLLAAIGAIGLVLPHQPEPRPWMIFWLCLVGWFCALTTQPYPKNLNQILPAVALLGGYGLQWLSVFCDERKKLALAVSFSLLLAVNLAWSAARLASGPHANQEMLDFRQLAIFLKAHTRPTDSIYNWGNEWELYYEADRLGATRHINQSLMICMAHAAYVRGYPFRERATLEQNILLKELLSQRPLYIVVSAPFVDFGAKDYFAPRAVEAIVAHDYEPCAGPPSQFYQLYRRKEAAAP